RRCVGWLADNASSDRRRPPSIAAPVVRRRAPERDVVMAQRGAAPVFGAPARRRPPRVVATGVTDHHASLAEERLSAIVVTIRVRREDRGRPLPRPDEQVLDAVVSAR